MKRLGNNIGINVTSITHDIGGNVYVTGMFNGILDMDANSTSYTLSAPASSGTEDAFLVKYNPNGIFSWAQSVSGPNAQSITSLVADQVNNNIIISGSYKDLSNFDLSATNSTLTSNSNSTNLFVATYNSLGNFIQVSSANTNFGDGYISDIDLKGNLIYVVGNFSGTYDFDPSPSTFNSSSIYKSGFIWSLNKNTGAFNYQKKLTQNGTGICLPSSISLLNQKMYIGGWFEDVVDFDASVSTFTLNSGSSINKDAFNLCYDLSGNFVWANKLQSTTTNVNEICFDISVSKNGNLYSCGIFDGITDFNPSSTATHTLINFFGQDAYVNCLDTLGNFKYVNGYTTNSSSNEYCTNVYSSSKEVFLLGETSGGQINLKFGASSYYVPIGSNLPVVFFAKYNVVSPPTANFNISPFATCITSCLSFTDISVGIPNQWSWSFPGAFPSISSVKNPANICYTTAGTYTISLTASNGAGTSTYSTSIYINPPPSITITPGSTLLCSGQSLVLTASGANTYTWSNASIGNQLVTNLSSNTPISVTFNLTGSTLAGCTSTATSPPIQIALCTGLSDKLTEDTNLLMYPNPTTDKTEFISDEIIETVDITSVMGQQIAQLNFNSTMGTIDLRALSNGVYLAIFKQKSKSITKRLVKN